MLPAALLALGAVSACTSTSSVTPTASAPAKSRVIIEQPWVRGTEGSQDASMSAAYFTVTNPGSSDVWVAGGQSPVAGMVQVHEMATVDGKMGMREAKDGIRVPAGGHEHFAPGGPHLMLMQLTKPLNVGDEVAVTVRFSDGSTQAVVAPVKKFTEEGDQYHTHASETPTPPAPSQS